MAVSLQSPLFLYTFTISYDAREFTIRLEYKVVYYNTHKLPTFCTLGLQNIINLGKRPIVFLGTGTYLFILIATLPRELRK
jgi:hypothetical protein